MYTNGFDNNVRTSANATLTYILQNVERPLNVNLPSHFPILLPLSWFSLGATGCLRITDDCIPQEAKMTVHSTFASRI